MPIRPKRPCGHPSCHVLVDAGYCAVHELAYQHRTDAARQSANDRGYTSRWRKAARTYLASHPLCFYCGFEGRLRAATCVDHFIPHRGDQRLFWDTSNWRPACIPCNSRKAALEEGGFGNVRA